MSAAPPLRAGVDVVAVERVRAVLERHPGFTARVFTEAEVADACRGDVALTSEVAAARLAARFAAKEAARKALGGPPRWRDVEVRTRPDGAPVLWVGGAPAPAAVSLAHDGGVAIALVVAAPGNDA